MKTADPDYRPACCRPGSCIRVLAGAFALMSVLAPAERAAGAEAFDVDPTTGFRMERYRAPVPASIPGGVTLDTPALRERLEESDPALALILIDVFPPKGLGADPIDGHWVISEGHETLPGATWLPEVGRGHLTAEHEAYFRRNLERLTGGDRARDIVFFCTADCWQSWNAAKRAIDWGYSGVHWYPVGTDGWAEEGGERVEARPLNFFDDTVAAPATQPDNDADLEDDDADVDAEAEADAVGEEDGDGVDPEDRDSGSDEVLEAAATPAGVRGFPEEARLVLLDGDGVETAIGSVRFADNGDGSAQVDVVVEGDGFSDHFLNMYPFRCLADAPEWFCHLPYPYELEGSVRPDDLTDLEYQLLFVRKASSEFGIDTWNGVYYKLAPLDGGGFEGALFDGDLTVLQAPPEDPDVRPLDLTEFFDDEAKRRRFPRLRVLPSAPSR